MKIYHDPTSIWTAEYLMKFDEFEMWNIFDDFTEFNHLVRGDDMLIKKEIREWAKENDIDLWYISHTAEIFFNTEADAIAFKLKWS